MIAFESDQSRLLELLKTGVEKREVVLASGAKSDVYVDCKRGLLRGEGHLLAGRMLLRMMDTLLYDPTDAVAGVVLGGCSLASAVSTIAAISGRELPAIYVRKTPKDHGTKALIECPDLKYRDVVLLEDVITSGKSALDAVDRLEENGFKVTGVFGVVDREAGGVETIRMRDLECATLFKLKELVG